MLPGANGFRVWFEVKPPKKFELCGCGWSRLPHFSTSPDYKCETLEALESLNLVNSLICAKGEENMRYIAYVPRKMQRGKLYHNSHGSA